MTIPTEPGITLEIPVRWGDMDALGHVNNSVYFTYCESARIAYFDAVDLDGFKQKPTDGPALVAANLNFRKQMHYPGTVVVTANVTTVSTRSFTFTYSLRDKTGNTIVADGQSVVVWVDYEKAKAQPLPEEMVEVIARIEHNDDLGRQQNNA